jgi:hypothetical protein
VRYRMLPDAPVVKMTLELTNTGAEDFSGWFQYNVDPDSAVGAHDTSVVPGVAGTNPGLLTEGWTGNFVYTGPQVPASSPAHAIAWLGDEPDAVSARGDVFGAWFDASTPAGGTTEISWYHITDYAAEGDDPAAAVAAWAEALSDLDEDME